jgi:glycerophosphoryl diester phosphodiesterase
MAAMPLFFPPGRREPVPVRPVGDTHRVTSSSYPFLDHEGPIAFAHRGGAAGGLENSLAAFQRAVDLGYRYIETDAQATADGVLLAFHDRTLNRITDRVGRIAELPYSEVARARIGGVEPIPRMEDLLGTWPDVRINIDVKDPSAIGPLVEVLSRTGAVDRVCVAAFSDRRVRAARAALGPRLCTSVGPREVARLRAASYGRWLRRMAPLGVPCVQVPTVAARLALVDRRFVETAHALGMHVHVWTIDDRDEIERVLDLGVDGVMTDELEVLRDALIARGAWA